MAQEDWIKEIKKKFGEESIRKIGDHQVLDTESVSTGSILIDDVLGIGGLPLGRIVEIYGPEASGKSTIALQVAANIQKKYGDVLYIDTEHALNINYARDLGVDTDNMFLSQPSSGEEALSIAIKTADVGSGVRCIVLDSVAALSPQAELAGEIGDHTIGLQARLMSRCLRSITANLMRNKILFLCINQIRDKIGGMGYGCVEGTTEVATGNTAATKISQLKVGSTVKTFSQQKNCIEDEVCTSVFNNGKSDNFRQIRYVTPLSDTPKELTITSKHLVFSHETERWIEAKSLKINNSFLLHLKEEAAMYERAIVNDNRISVSKGRIMVDGKAAKMTPYILAKAILTIKSAQIDGVDKLFPYSLSELEKAKFAEYIVEHIERSGSDDYVPAIVVENRRLDGERDRYDLEVSKNTNYFANGILIHNSPETTPGGRALRFYSSVRMEIRRIGSINSKQMDLGGRVKVKITKNKFASPFKSIETEIYYGKGILMEAELLDACEAAGIVERSGSWYSYSGNKLGQGREQVVNRLTEDKELTGLLSKKLTEKKKDTGKS